MQCNGRFTIPFQSERFFAKPREKGTSSKQQQRKHQQTQAAKEQQQRTCRKAMTV